MKADTKMKFWAITASIAFAIAGCAGIPNQEAFKAKVSSWQGRNVNDLIKAWGKPDSILPGSSDKLYTYNKGDPVKTSCTVEFMVNPEGRITAWRFSGSTCRTIY